MDQGRIGPTLGFLHHQADKKTEDLPFPLSVLLKRAGVCGDDLTGRLFERFLIGDLSQPFLDGDRRRLFSSGDHFGEDDVFGRR